MAMNGWGAAEPSWWLNLRANPKAVVELPGGVRRDVIGRAAVGGERDRLWQRWRELDKDLGSYAARRPHETAVVVFAPARPDAPIPEPDVDLAVAHDVMGAANGLEPRSN